MSQSWRLLFIYVRVCVTVCDHINLTLRGQMLGSTVNCFFSSMLGPRFGSARAAPGLSSEACCSTTWCSTTNISFKETQFPWLPSSSSALLADVTRFKLIFPPVVCLIASPRSCNGRFASGSATLGLDHDVPGWRTLPLRLCWAAEEADSGTHWMRSHSPTLGLFGTERLVIDPPLFVATLSAVKSFPTGKDDYVLLFCLYSTLAVSCDQPFQSSLVVMPTENQRQSMLYRKMGCLYFTNRQVRPQCKLWINCYTCIQLFQYFHHNFKIISHILRSELQLTSV